jgi:uncharacterized protein
MGALNKGLGNLFALPPQAGGKKHRFHAMVKPIGTACNLKCTYCYYLYKSQLLGHQGNCMMSDEVLETHIRQYIESQTGEQVVFSWQGGEPTLLGLNFFRRIVELETKYRQPGQRIENDLQTNGTLLDEEWAIFLKRHNFLVGLSVDGPRAFHDRYRMTKGGEPTFDKVMVAAKLLKKHGVPFNALCVVNRENAQKPLDVYRFLTREVGVWRVQFMPCVEPRSFETVAPQYWDPDLMPVVGTPQSRPGQGDSVVTDWSVDPEDWGTFLCRVWDDWYSRDYGKIHVQLFETAVAQAMGLPSLICVHNDFCGKGIAVEHNGDVFACDHYVYPEYRRGNIMANHLAGFAYSEEQKEFGFSKRESLPLYCRQCPHLRLCWGECPKNRFVRTPDGETGLNYLCPGQRQFFDHIHRDLPEILRRVRNKRM